MNADELLNDDFEELAVDKPDNTEALADLQEFYLELEKLWEDFKTYHHKGVVKRDVNAARRRARVVSIELAKQLKEYRTLSNNIGKNT